MPTDSAPTHVPHAPHASPAHPLWLRRLLFAAVASIVLGLVIQVLVMLAMRKWPASPIAETAQKVTWSTLVCSALAIGTTARKALPGVLGMLGLLAAPGAFYAAKAVQKSLSQAASGAGPSVPNAPELALAKAIEYGIFGLLIALVAVRKDRGLRTYVAIGAALGVVFTIYLLIRLASNDPRPPGPVLAARAVNELVFPIGCALVLWAANRIGKQLASPGAAAPRT